MAKRSFVVLISGSGTNLQAIIDAVNDGRIDAVISAVISNRADAKGLQRARQAQIETVVVDQKEHEDRAAYDRALVSIIDTFAPDLVVLAGFISHYEHRILNIHPSLLPEFKGLHTHRRALQAAKQVHGASVHFVSNELDSGPIVIQAEVPVLENDTEESLAQRVLQQEHVIYPVAIALFVDGRLETNGNDVLLDGKALHRPLLWKSDQLVVPEPA